MKQFEAHKSRLLSIAEKGIINGDMDGNTVWVFTADI